MRLLSLLPLVACAPSIAPDTTDTGGSASEVTAGEAWIDATSSSDWAWLDLVAGATVEEPANPADSDVWDLGLRRQAIQINGGVSGTGGMEVVPLAGVDYNTAIEAPTEGWITDQADADDDGDLEYAFDSWFEYDSGTHQLAAADITWVVKAVGGELFKLRVLDYYDEAGTSGMIHLRWGPLSDVVEEDTGDTGDTGTGEQLACTTDPTRVTSEEAAGVTTTTLSTAETDDWVCFDFGAGRVDTANDLAMQKWTAITSGEVATLPGQDFAALTQAPANGYVADDGTGSAFGDWYDYDGTSHLILPKDLVFVLHTAGGAWYKLKFTSYYPADGDTTKPHHPTFLWAPVSAP